MAFFVPDLARRKCWSGEHCWSRRKCWIVPRKFQNFCKTHHSNWMFGWEMFSAHGSWLRNAPCSSEDVNHARHQDFGDEPSAGISSFWLYAAIAYCLPLTANVDSGPRSIGGWQAICKTPGLQLILDLRMNFIACRIQNSHWAVRIQYNSFTEVQELH